MENTKCKVENNVDSTGDTLPLNDNNGKNDTMREIKFRGKRLDGREWVDGFYIKNPDIPAGQDKHEVLISDGYECTPVDPVTVSQFTGLLDKNGRKIYEGDIFKTTDSNGDCRVRVDWDEENARFIGRDQRGRIWYVGREPLIEVIGNIHENPELLKTK